MDKNRLSMKHTFILLFATIVAFSATAQQQATVIESLQTVKTYPFSDPNPVANPSNLFYPYFRFDGFALKATDKQWKTVTLENEYIRLTVFPEIGGKLWSAYDKTSNREFLYHNHDDRCNGKYGYEMGCLCISVTRLPFRRYIS